MTRGVTHGGLTENERAGFAARGVPIIDLSASINPYGPHPRVVRAARCAAVDRYPEPDAATMRQAYAAATGLPGDSILPGNGSSDLIYLLARAFARRAVPCLIAGPTFAEYAAASRAAGAEAVECRIAVGPEFAPDLPMLLHAIREYRPALTFLCNPNNPTGTLVAREAVESLTEAVHAVSGRLVVDEAYMDFVGTDDQRAAPGASRLVLRTLTKLHAIPGLRAGFLLGPPDDIAAVAELQPPWTVGAPAAAAASQALQEREFVARSRRRIAATRTWLYEQLRQRGLRVVPSAANFLLVEAGNGAEVRRRLLERGFAVRDCTSFGLPHHVRIAIPRAEQVSELLAALEECVA